MRRERLALVGAALLAACGAGPEPGGARGLLVIAIEGLRADHVSCYGYERETTPELDQLARDGVRFEQCFAPAPSVVPSAAALLSGCDPLVARRNLPSDVLATIPSAWSLPKQAPHLAQELLGDDFDTAAFLDHALLGPASGMALGFQEFQGASSDLPAVVDAQGTPGVFERFRRWLDERGRGARWFALVQVSALARTWSESDPAWDGFFRPRDALRDVPPVADANRIYFAVPRARWPGGVRTLGEYEAKYDGALRKLDGALGRLLADLRSSGRYDATTIVVVSTNGVGFGEAGLYLDSGTLADVDLHVPLVIKPAMGLACARGATVRSLASVLDVAPTALALAGVPAPSDMQGVSLVPALTDPDAELHRFLFASCGYQQGECVIGSRWCYERTEPWNAEDAGLVFSWYGGRPPAEPKPREVLHDRANDASVGHARSAPLDPARVEALRAAAARWNQDVERLRRRFNPAEWLDAPAPGGEPQR